jgi:ribulose bisphosphate carboxylase small subunit
MNWLDLAALAPHQNAPSVAAVNGYQIGREHSQFSGCRNEFWQSFYAGYRSFSRFSCV